STVRADPSGSTCPRCRGLSTLRVAEGLPDDSRIVPASRQLSAGMTTSPPARHGRDMRLALDRAAGPVATLGYPEICLGTGEKDRPRPPCQRLACLRSAMEAAGNSFGFQRSNRKEGVELVGRLRPVRCPELLHDRPDVNLDGALAHVEFVGDRLVRLAAPEGVRHCRLARSEVLLDPRLALDLLDNSVTEGKDARCRKEDAPGRCQPRRLDHHIRADAARDVPSRPVIDGGDHFREFFGFRKNDYRNIISLTDEVPDLLGNGGLGDTPPPDTQKDRDGRSAHVAGLPFTDRAVGG